MPDPNPASSRCARAGCNEPGTVRVSQEDEWAMLLPAGMESAWFCEADADAIERVGGVRV